MVHLERAFKIAPGRADFKRALEEARKKSRLQRLMADALKAEKRGDVWGVLSLLREALRLDPSDPSVRSLLERVRPKFDRLADQALKDLEKAAKRGDTAKAVEASGRLSILSALDASVADRVRSRRRVLIEAALKDFLRLAVEGGDLEAAGKALGEAVRLAKGDERLETMVTSSMAEAKRSLLERSKEAERKGRIEEALRLAARAKRLLAAPDPEVERWIAYLKALHEAGPEAKRRAWSLLKAGFPERAESEIRSYLSVNPEDPEGWEVLAQILESLGKKGEAAEASRKARLLRARAEAERTPPTLESKVAFIRALIRQGLFEEAEREARELVKDHPHAPKAFEALFEALKAGRKEEAKQAYLRLIELRAEVARKRASLSRDAFERLLAGLPLPEGARFERALLLALEGDWGSARSLASRLFPPLREFLLSVLSPDPGAGLRMALGMEDETLRRCAEAFLSFRLGNLKRAGALWHRLVGKVKGAEREAAFIMVEQGAFDRARSLLKGHLNSFGADPLAHLDMALLLAYTGDMEVALAHARLAARLAPRSPLAKAIEAIILAFFDPSSALKTLDSLPRTKINSPPALVARAFALERAGRRPEALSVLERLRGVTTGTIGLLEVPGLKGCLSLAMRLGRPPLVAPER